MTSKYLPVDLDFLKQIELSVSAGETVKIFFFNQENSLGDANGRIKEIKTGEKNGEFVVFENGQQIRLDRIIVFNGKPGPAYDEYDSYALACLDCMGGMD